MKEISDKDKLAYINHLLEVNQAFKIEFLNHLNFQKKVETTYKNKNLDSLVDEIFDSFNKVDLELYLGDCHCQHGGYYDDYENDISEELVEDLFIEVVKKIDGFIKKSDFYGALFILVAVGKAIDLKPTLDDDYGLIYDYHDLLSEHHSFLVSKFIDKLKDTNISLETRKQFVSFLIENSDEPDELKVFEYLFDMLLTTTEMGVFASSFIGKFHINVQLKILNLLEDDEGYINTAKQFYKENTNIAEKLLQKLNEISAYNDYENIAKECFLKNASYFVTEIFNVITYDKSKDFYLEVLKYKVLNHCNLDEYILYKKYLNETQIDDLQNMILKSHRQEYCIKVLEYEKKYESILNIAKQERYDLKMVLEPIKFHFPKECFDIVVKNCNQAMNSYDRNRNTYIKICGFLNIMAKVPTVKNDIELYIKTTLINRKPNLPALKDELIKAKLL
jgi:hypothetical protein